MPERSLLHRAEILCLPKTAPRGFATTPKQAAKEKVPASVCRIRENWHPQLKLASGFCVYAYANPNRYIDPTGKYGIFFDGTGNNQNDPAYGNHTNIAKLSRLYDQTFGRDYQQGVGTGDGEWLFHETFGKGVQSRVDSAYTKLVSFYNSDAAREMRRNDPQRWEEIRQIDLFGFSRGATEARLLVNLIKQRGIPNYEDSYTQEVLVGLGSNVSWQERKFYRNFKDVDIRFMGLFDTVDARGTPLSSAFRASLAIDPKFVRNTVHLVASNEYRRGFDAVSACQGMEVCDPSIQEIYLPGAHADVGGSYGDIAFEGSFNITKKRHGLDKFALALMWVEAKNRGVPLALPALKDRTGIDPYRLTDQQLRRFIHDSRSEASGFFDRISSRASRTILYANGSGQTLSAEELAKRWRSQLGLSERVTEGGDGQNKTVTE